MEAPDVLVASDFLSTSIPRGSYFCDADSDQARRAASCCPRWLLQEGLWITAMALYGPVMDHFLQILSAEQ